MRRSNSRKRRDTIAIANQRLPVSINPLDDLLMDRSVFSLGEIEDRRRWNPEGDYAPARSVNSSRHRLHAVDSHRENVSRGSTRSRFKAANVWKSLSARIGFERPQGVLICMRRKMRREVLHALNKAGRVGQRRPRRGWYSDISCRRKK